MGSIKQLLGILLIVMGTAGVALALDQPGVIAGDGNDGAKGGNQGNGKGGNNKGDKAGDDRPGKRWGTKPGKKGNKPGDRDTYRGAPEIDPAATLSGLALLSGVLLVVRGDRRI